MRWKRVYCFLQEWPPSGRCPCSSLQSQEPKRGSGWGSMLAELPKTCGNKARRRLKLLRIEERNIWKQAKKRQERRYKQLLKQSKRTYCDRPRDPVRLAKNEHSSLFELRTHAGLPCLLDGPATSGDVVPM